MIPSMAEHLSSMSQQLRSDAVLDQRLASPWRKVVVLERLARGGGSANWYFARSPAELERIFDMLHGGSCVSFYFADQLHVEHDSDQTRQRMYAAITTDKELVLGYPPAAGVELEMDIISGPSELTEELMLHREGDLAVWGPWPGRVNDGQDAITVNLVDADGILRQHPH
jgi:hypothetical protein